MPFKIYYAPPYLLKLLRVQVFKEDVKGITPGPDLIYKESHLEAHRNGELAAERNSAASFVSHSLVEEGREESMTTSRLLQVP